MYNDPRAKDLLAQYPRQLAEGGDVAAKPTQSWQAPAVQQRKTSLTPLYAPGEVPAGFTGKYIDPTVLSASQQNARDRAAQDAMLRASLKETGLQNFGGSDYRQLQKAIRRGDITAENIKKEFVDPVFEKRVQNAYAAIGRTGAVMPTLQMPEADRKGVVTPTADTYKNVTQGEYDYWSNMLKEGKISGADFQKAFLTKAANEVPATDLEAQRVYINNARKALGLPELEAAPKPSTSAPFVGFNAGVQSSPMLNLNNFNTFNKPSTPETTDLAPIPLGATPTQLFNQGGAVEKKSGESEQGSDARYTKRFENGGDVTSYARDALDYVKSNVVDPAADLAYEGWKMAVPSNERFALQTLFGDRSKPFTNKDLTEDELAQYAKIISESEQRKARDLPSFIKANQEALKEPAVRMNLPKDDSQWTAADWDAYNAAEKAGKNRADIQKKTARAIKDLEGIPKGVGNIQYQDYAADGLSEDEINMANTIGRFNYKKDKTGKASIKDRWDFINENDLPYVEKYEKLRPLSKYWEVLKDTVELGDIGALPAQAAMAYLGREGRDVNLTAPKANPKKPKKFENGGDVTPAKSKVKENLDAIMQGLKNEDVSAKDVALFINSFIPVSGDIQSAAEGYQAFKDKDYVGAGLGAAGALPLVPNITKYVKASPKEMDKFFEEMAGSKIRDAEGQLAKVYHGGAGLEEGLPTKGTGIFAEGVYFSGIPSRTRYYGEKAKNGTTYPMYANIKNPISSEEFTKRFGTANPKNSKKIRDILVAEGYDGVLSKSGDKIWEGVSFFPEEQLKSSVSSITPKMKDEMLKEDVKAFNKYAHGGEVGKFIKSKK